MKKLITAVLILVLSFSLTACASYSEKGLQHLEDKDYKQAIEVFEKGIKKDKDIGECYRGIGLAKWAQKDYKGAAQALEKALTNGSAKTATLYNMIAVSQLKEKQYDSALNYFRMALKSDDLSDDLEQEIRYNMIASYEKTGDYASARSLLEQYVSDYPDDETAQKELDFLKTRDV